MNWPSTSHQLPPPSSAASILPMPVQESNFDQSESSTDEELQSEVDEEDASSSSVESDSDSAASTGDLALALVDFDAEEATETVRRRPFLGISSTNEEIDDTFGAFSPTKADDMAILAVNRDSLGLLALLIPITGISTMVLTELLACTHHFDCSTNYPTLSYAATFKPEGYAFTIGMCATAIFIFVTILLFGWFLQLRLASMTPDSTASIVRMACVVAGVISAISLFGLAAMDMGSHHDAHINFTVVFFICAWITMILVQIARSKLLHGQDPDVRQLKFTVYVLDPRACWAAIESGRWRRMSIFTAYDVGRLFLFTGVASTVLFGLLYMCVNGFWANPMGFTAVQEAFFEAFAIVCQLLFMGTLSCELSLLNRTVEQHEYALLNRHL